jgi:hypothetical protein
VRGSRISPKALYVGFLTAFDDDDPVPFQSDEGFLNRCRRSRQKFREPGDFKCAGALIIVRVERYHRHEPRRHVRIWVASVVMGDVVQDTLALSLQPTKAVKLGKLLAG